MSATRLNKNRFIPSVECLESRELMSVTSITMNAAGSLTVVCDGADNIVSVTETTAKVSQNAPMASMAVGPQGPVSIFDSIVVKDGTTNTSWVCQRTGVNAVVIIAGSGNNTVSANLDLETVVIAGDGNNNVQTGSGNDVVVLGNGNNTVLTNDGDDYVFVGSGNNYINGGNGNDHLYGGTGIDVIFGGAGNDYITDACDPNRPNSYSVLYGDAGNDTIISTKPNSVVDGGDGYDTLKVKGSSWVVRNGENVTVGVPLGTLNNQLNFGKFSAVDCANRLLQSNGYTNSPGGVILSDADYGLAPDTLTAYLQRVKKDTTLETDSNIQRLATLVQSGKPVLIPICTMMDNSGYKTWIVVNGYDSATQTFSYVEGGVQYTLNSYNLDRMWSVPGFGFWNTQNRALVY